MSRQWIVVADSGRARIFFRARRDGALEELEDLANPEALMRPRELTSDRAGRSYSTAGGGRTRHALETRTDPREQKALNFAGRIADRIDAGRAEGHFDELVIAAAPHFLGDLRQSLSAPSKKLVCLELDKDLVGLDAAAIRSHVDAAAGQAS
jgi:protein required for attachment to host cells